MAGYTPASSIGQGFGPNAYTYGQYNNQGYTTLQYAAPAPPSMSLARAAWLNITGDYMSTTPGLSTVDNAAMIQQRARMFWDSGFRTFGSGFAQGMAYLTLNAGNLFSSAGKFLGGYHGSLVPEVVNGIEVIPQGFYDAANWAKGTRGTFGRALYKFGHWGEYGGLNKHLYYNLTRRAAAQFAEMGPQPLAALSDILPESPGFGNTIAGWFRAGKGGFIENMAEHFGANPAKSGSLFERVALYAEQNGLLKTFGRSFRRLGAGLIGQTAYFLGTGALINGAASALSNAFFAGDEATLDAALQFTALKDKIFNNVGKISPEENARKIAEAIRQKAITDTGISGMFTKAVFGKRLDERINKTTALYGLFANYGLVGKSGSAEEFIQKASQLEEAVKKLAKTFGSTTSQAIDMVRAMKSQGISNNNLVKAGENLRLTQAISGYTAMQTMAIQSHGSEAMRGTMFDTTLGIGIANDVIQKTAIAAELQPGWNKTLFALRGKDSTNVALTRAMANLAKSTDVRSAFIASLYEKRGDRYVYTGHVNQRVLNEAFAGRGTYITDRPTQDLLVQRYLTELSVSERASAGREIQRATSHMSVTGFNNLLSSVMSSAGYKSKEAGLVAYFMQQGFSPEVAASAAKAMSRNTTSTTMATQFRIDAMRQLRNRLAGGISTSILGAIGDNLDLGLVSSFASGLGSLSNGIFGRAAGFVESGAAAGLGTALAYGSATAGGLMTLPFAALAAGYSARRGVAALTGLRSNIATTLVGAAPLTVGGLAGIGTVRGILAARNASVAAGAVGDATFAGVTATGLVAGGAIAASGGYLGYRLGSEAASKLFYGKSIADLYNEGHTTAAGTLRTAGTAIGAVGASWVAGSTVASLAFLANPLVLAGVGATAAGVGLYNYMREAGDLDAAKQRKKILSKVQSVIGLRGLTKSTIAEAEAAYSTHAKMTMAYSKSLGDIPKILKTHTLGLNRALAGGYESNPEAAILNALQAAMPGKELAQVNALIKKDWTVNAIPGGYGAYIQKNLVTALDLYKGDMLNATAGPSAYILRNLKYMYSHGNQTVKDTIIKMTNGLDKGVFSGDIKYKTIKDYLEKSGTAALGSINLSSAQISNALASANATLGLAGGSAIEEAQATNVASMVEALIAKGYKGRQSIATSEGAIEYYSQSYGLSKKIVTNILSAAAMKKDEDLKRAVGNLALVGVTNAHQMINRQIMKATASGLRGLGDVLHKNVTTALTELATTGSISIERSKELVKDLASVKGNKFASKVEALITARQHLTQEAGNALFNAGAIDYNAYKSKMGVHGVLSRSQFMEAAGSDAYLTADELRNYARNVFSRRQVAELTAEENTIAPKDRVESALKAVEDIAQVLKGRFGPDGKGREPGKDPTGVSAGVIGAPVAAKTSSEKR